MEHDIEAAGAASLGGLSKGTHHPVNSGKPCENCGAVVPDRFCSACGQLASSFHRPLWQLVSESIADMFALDGRLLRSLPLLMFRPGRMTRNYLDGKRARYVPPFRMFLLASVIFFLTIFTMNDTQRWFEGWTFDPYSKSGMDFSPSAIDAALDAPPAGAPAGPETPPADDVVADSVRFADIMQPDGTIDRAKLHEMVKQQASPGTTDAELRTSFLAADKAATVYENQDRFGVRLRQWAPRFSLLFLPVFALLLTLMYAWWRKFYVFDHLVASLHFQTFLYILGTLVLLFTAIFPHLAYAAPGAALLAVFVYIYRMLRVIYGSGLVASLLGATILLIFSMILLVSLAVGLVILSFVLT
ncbi:MAG: DUF3667 domain-containing protein [Hyphomonas oceanitis]|uniref:DUF3667 domain-containing protein n=1 Tax=Hyphomonas oceanitis TaxID=81033 RepID=UPI003002EF04